jgi:hypothetical protein
MILHIKTGVRMVRWIILLFMNNLIDYSQIKTWEIIADDSEFMSLEDATTAIIEVYKEIFYLFNK